jgi:hypothetical protein
MTQSQLVTLFTVIFMTTIATLVKRYALWKGQEGATVAELELYQASVSLPSTIKMIVLLRQFSLASVALVFIWSWYYLGSQAVSREYGFQLSSRKIHTNLIFPSAEVTSKFQNASGIQTVDLSNLNSYFNSVTGSDGSIGRPSVDGTDRAGNALLPMLNPSFQANKEWCNTRNDNVALGDCVIAYASSIGIPVFSSDPRSTAWVGTFQLSTSYIYANCDGPTIGNASDFPLGALPALKTSFNVTNQTSDGYAQVQVSNRVSNSSIHTTCNLERHYIDAQAQCDTSACIFNQARPTPGKPTAPATQFLDFSFSQRFFEQLLLVNGIPIGEEVPSNVEMPGPIWEEGVWTGYPDNTAASEAQEFSRDMSIFINTYMAASQQTFYTSPIEEGDTKAQIAAYFKMSPLNVIWPLATAKGAPYDPQYVLSIPWITIDIITCSILFAAAMASHWLRMQTVAPDIFGYVSSMTRDNPHLNLPDGGSTMSGSERARALKNLRVKIADLNRGQGVGHIGLAAADMDVEMGRLEKTRHYV